MLTRLAVFYLLLLTSAAGAAQEALAPRAPGAEVSAYTALIHEAIRAQEQEDFTSARRLFEQAHALDANARTLRGMGVAAFRAGDLQQAAVDLSASLAHPNKPLDDELQRAVRALLTEIMGRLRADDAASELTASHLVTVDSAATEGKPHTLLSTAGPASLARPVADHAPGATRRASLSTLAAGSALVLGAGALWLTGALRIARIEDACGSSCSQAFVEREAERAGLARFETSINVMAGSAAIVLGTSLGLFFWERGAVKRNTKLSLGPKSFVYTAHF